MRNGVSFCKNHFLIGLSVDGIKATHDLYRKDAVGKDTYFRFGISEAFGSAGVGI